MKEKSNPNKYVRIEVVRRRTEEEADGNEIVKTGRKRKG